MRAVSHLRVAPAHNIAQLEHHQINSRKATAKYKRVRLTPPPPTRCLCLRVNLRFNEFKQKIKKIIIFFLRGK